jgi:hypothetical protein
MSTTKKTEGNLVEFAPGRRKKAQGKKLVYASGKLGYFSLHGEPYTSPSGMFYKVPTQAEYRALVDADPALLKNGSIDVVKGKYTPGK